ncbi:hypothetical protein BH11BAC4_BH11BAC4_05820 [soil metagenome]
MEKYPLSLIQNTLIEWKYAKKYSKEVKTYDIKDKLNGEMDIILKNKIRIINKGGTFDMQADPAKFHTNSLAVASLVDEPENERLKDFLRGFDNEVYIQAEEGERSTQQYTRFFEK